MAEDVERQNRRIYLYKEREKFAKAQEWISTIRDKDLEMEDSESAETAVNADWHSPKCL
jgi:hypothetical protein